MMDSHDSIPTPTRRFPRRILLVVPAALARSLAACAPAMDRLIALECGRSDIMLSLRKDFEREVRFRFGQPPANEMLNSWLFVQIARAHVHARGVAPDDWLFVPLPPQTEPTAWPFSKYLDRMRERRNCERIGIDAEAPARSLDRWMREAWEGARRRLGEIRVACHADHTHAVRSCAAANGDEASGGLRVWIEPAPAGQLSAHAVNAQALAKLRDAHAACSDDGGSNDFDARLWLMLHRYASLFGPRSGEGRGWQLATPPAAMAAMHADFGVCAELFASPLNSRTRRFCSAFPDTDAPFGSLGNFFSADIRGIESAECGPPYDDEVIHSSESTRPPPRSAVLA